ncbi:MAG: sugar transferase, partial [Myxococcota bacterium]
MSTSKRKEKDNIRPRNAPQSVNQAQILTLTASEISGVHSNFRIPERAWGERFRKAGDRLFWTDFVLRCFDFLFASFALVMLSPFFLFCAICIRWTSRGPVFFQQDRAGRYGHAFRMFKFRSMCADAEAKKEELLEQNEQEGGVIFKLKKDPRITAIGGFLRRWSLDELPQLWNVV